MGVIRDCPRLQRDVALKILPEVFASDPDHSERHIAAQHQLIKENCPPVCWPTASRRAPSPLARA